jgi:hypothetical protein
VEPIFPDLTPVQPLEGHGLDISLGGMCFWLPEPLDTPHVRIHLPFSQPSGPLAVTANVRRVQPGKAGGYEFGVRFLKELP